MNAEQIADKIYDDLKDNIDEWALENSKARYSPNGGYIDYPNEPEEYIDNLIEKVSDELRKMFNSDIDYTNIFYETF